MKFTESLLFKLVAIACCIIIALITIFWVVACCMIKDQLFVNSVKLSDNGELVVVYSDGSTNTFVIPTQIGENGKSAYELYLETVPEEETPMTVDEWLESLKGQNGDKGTDGVGILTAVINENGELVITLTDGNEVNLGVVVGEDGENGADGLTPYIGENGNWFIGDTDTGVFAQGKDGVGIKNITINENGELVITLTDGNEVNLGVVVGKDGNNGADGLTPYIGENGNWFIGDTDTGVFAQGKDGVGIKNITINENGELVITLTDGNEVNLGVVVGEDGENAVGIETIHQNGDKVTIVLTDYSVYEIDLSGNKIS